MSLTTAIVIFFSLYLINIILSHYRVFYKKLGATRFWRIDTFSGLIIIFFIIIGPLVFTFINGEVTFSNSMEKVQYGENNDKPNLIKEGCKEILEENFFHVDCHFKLIDQLFFSYESIDINNYKNRLISITDDDKKENREFSYLVLGYIDCISNTTTDKLRFLNKITSDTLKYLNYIYGLNFMDLNHDAKAIYYFNKEIKCNGYIDGAVKKLCLIHNKNKSLDSLRTLASNDLTSPYLSRSLKKEIFFKDANLRMYISQLFGRFLDNLSWMGLFAALLISIIWGNFLRQFHLYKKEKVTYLIFMFSLGALFSFLVYPLSDFLIFVFHLNLNGEFINDLVYTSTVIGCVEEFSKILPFLLVLKFCKFINEPFDYILYASVSALGFAFIENIIYFEEYQFQVVFTRTVYSVVGHMFWTSIFSYGLLMYVFRKNRDFRFSYYLVVAFFASALGHGMFDVFLFYDLLNINTMFFFISLLIYIFMINNSLNISSHYNYKIRLKREKIAFQLIIGLIGIYMLQYLFIGINYGAIQANTMGVLNLPFGLIMITFLVLLFSRVQIKKGEWRSIGSLSFIPEFSLNGFGFFTLFDVFQDTPSVESAENRLFAGLRLRFFTPKENHYLGQQFPIVGRLIKNVIVSDEKEWYLVELQKPLDVRNCLVFKVLVKASDVKKDLTENKISVNFMMIPDAKLLGKKNIHKEDLFLIDRVYSICLS